ncbi:MAG: PEP-CTERM sorting domain-containing protein [Planctomycetota bacterium]
MKMKLLGFCAAGLLASPVMAEVIAVEDFSDDIGFTTSVPQISDSFGDFFTRTDGSNIGTFYSVTGATGSWFAAMDTNAEPGFNIGFVTLDAITITDFTDITVSIDLAEDDDGTNEDWDANSSVSLQASVDGGAFFDLLVVEAQGGTNTAPAIDTTGDGLGDGTEITDTFATFTSDLGTTGDSLVIRVQIAELESGDEDISFDTIVVEGVPEPASLALVGLGGLAMFGRGRRRA